MPRLPPEYLLDPRSRETQAYLRGLRDGGAHLETAHRALRSAVATDPSLAEARLAVPLGTVRRRRGPARGAAVRGLLVSALALALAATAASQVPPLPVFAVGVEGVYADVFVTEGNRPVVGLTASDFELRDNGVRRAVELVAVESLPLTTFLVLDTSGSVDGDNLVQLQAAGREPR
jgi:hypothetical protein